MAVTESEPLAPADIAVERTLSWQALVPAAIFLAVRVLLTVGVIAGAVMLLVVGVWQRVEWPLLVYGGSVMAMCLGSSSLMHAKPRFLLPAAMTLLVPVALGLA